MEFSHQSFYLLYLCFLLSWRIRASLVTKAHEGRAENLHPFIKLAFFDFCTFLSEDWTLFNVMFHSGLWFGYFFSFLTHMHLFLFKFCTQNHSLWLCHSSSAAFLLLIDPKRDLSWRRWHPVWFYHMCLRWNFWFLFALYIYVYKWLIRSFASVFICSCPHQQRLCETNDTLHDVTGSTEYWWSWADWGVGL